MVLYFSATGNTEFIARELAKRLDDECVNLLERVKTDNHDPLHSDKPFVICAPVYVCEMPAFMARYLKAQTFTGSRDVYGIFTSGGYCGVAGVLEKDLFKKKGMTFRGYAEFVMPRNYVANDHYPMLKKEEIEARILNAYDQVEQVAADIRDGRELTPARRVQLWELIVTVPFTPVWSRLKMTAKDFYAKDNCIDCGNCAKLCPLNNIRLTEGKPVWSNQCTHCMACIGNCPVEAIEYGTITKEKRPYNFGKYSCVVKALKK